MNTRRHQRHLAGLLLPQTWYWLKLGMFRVLKPWLVVAIYRQPLLSLLEGTPAPNCLNPNIMLRSTPCRYRHTARQRIDYQVNFRSKSFRSSRCEMVWAMQICWASYGSGLVAFEVHIHNENQRFCHLGRWKTKPSTHQMTASIAFQLRWGSSVSSISGHITIKMNYELENLKPRPTYCTLKHVLSQQWNLTPDFSTCSEGGMQRWEPGLHLSCFESSVLCYD